MNQYLAAQLLRIYTSALGKTLRFLLFFLLFSSIVLVFPNGLFPRAEFSFFIVLLVVEIFLHYKIGNISPSIPVSSFTDQQMYSSMTKTLLYAYIRKHTVSSLVQELYALPQGVFIFEKIGITKKAIQLVNIPKEQLILQAVALVKESSGTFITTMDVLGAYFLLSEQQTKLLFDKQLKPEDIKNIIQWARITFPYEEHPLPTRVRFNGDGIGDLLTTGWTPETKKYTNDFTRHALTQKPLLSGREKEYHTMVEVLLKKENNNVLLVGERGVGKDDLVEAFAFESFVGNVQEGLNHKRIFELMVGAFLAGATTAGDLEARLQTIIGEISHAGNVILYIPEFQNVVGSSLHVDISGVLLPYLKNGKLPIIATITPSFYKTYLEQNALKEVFGVITLEEPDTIVAQKMLFAKTEEIEKEHKVIVSYRAVKASVMYAKRYLADSVLPGSAVSLLNDVGNRVSLAQIPFFANTKKKLVTEEDILVKIQEETNIAVGVPKEKEKELLLHLEDKLHERVIDQTDAISAIAESMRRLRTGLTSEQKPISFLFLGPTGVGKTETAKALAYYYFGDENRMLRFDMSEYANDEGVKRLLGALPGEGNERGELTDKIHDHPFSLVLLDEFEKAHPTILDLFLQVLDDGRLTDNKGRTVSFANAIIIATSNAASEFIREEVEKGGVVDKQFHQKLLEFLQVNGLFKPELLNRFDEVITFKPLGKEEMKAITLLLLKTVSKKLQEQDITVSFDDTAVVKIVESGFDQQFGARPVRRYIQDTIEDTIATKMLKEEIKRGSTVVVSVTDNNFVFSIK